MSINNKNNKNFRFETIAIQNSNEVSELGENSTPIYLNSGYRFPDSQTSSALFQEEIPGFVYSRYGNPNLVEFEKKMCALEGLDAAFATASGMGAVCLGLTSLLSSGDHLVACRSLFGSTNLLLSKILPRWGISHTFLDINTPEKWADAITSNTKLLFLETPSNPGLDIVDLEFAGKLAKENGLIFMVDNCFASPYLQQPAKFGADVIIHSATKIIDGQGRVLGGIVISKKQLFEQIKFTARHSGPTMSPFNAWLLSKSLETLAVRLDRQCATAKEIASRLQEHPEVLAVKYPFLDSHPQYEIAKRQMSQGGSMVTAELKGGINRAMLFVDNLKMIRISANLGDAKTLITHPFLTTHSKLTPEERSLVNISDELLRISVGLENVEDIWQDIAEAIAASK